MGERSQLRPGLAAECGSGLGALSKWPVGLGRLLWLDLGELRSLGLGAVSLWPLVHGARADGPGIRDRWVRYPYWAPAYVGFFGFGPGLGIGVGFGFGGVGWVALAPFEVFHPWWGRGFYGGFAGGAFGSHTMIVKQRECVQFVPQRASGGRCDRREHRGVRTRRADRGAESRAASRGGRAAWRGAGGAGSIQPAVFRSRGERPIIRRRARKVSRAVCQATHVQHASFEQQQRGMQQMSRGNFSPSAGRSSFGGASSGRSSDGGWSRFGDPTRSGAGSNYGARGDATSAYGRSSGYSGGGVRISPRIVQQRGAYSSPGGGSSQPRGFGGARVAPSYGNARPGSQSAPRAPSSTGSSGRSGGGGGHHR